MGKKAEKPREDQRVRLTKVLIRGAFLQLLEKKPVRGVTVKELCELAGVNRGTFYLHYHDVAELMESLQNEMLDDLDELLRQTPVIVEVGSARATMGLISPLLRFFERNRDLCAVMLGDNGDKKFVAAIIERGRAKSLKEYLATFPGQSRQKIEVFYYFVAWGFVGLIQQSLQQAGAMPTFKTTAEYAERIVAKAALFFADDI